DGLNVLPGPFRVQKVDRLHELLSVKLRQPVILHMTTAFSSKMTSMATNKSQRGGIDLSLLARPEIQKVMSEINNLSPGIGQILAIHGDSGTGKSSLARSLLR